MTKTFLFLVVIVITCVNFSFAQLAPIDSVIEGNINSDAVLVNSKKYLLRGFVNVNPPAKLTIQPGTIIYGEQTSKGTLIINRGAQLFAEGTKTQPIVFTSQQPAGQRGAGDWGGIIIAGNASINVPGGTAVIEGGTGTIYGGGGNPNDDDNSGVIKHVRIEFSGIAFLPDNEINGLTMGGVGKGTTIEYVQVSYCGDDSFEWFGGTVNGKYLISYAPVDDDFDTDFGFRGKIQFGFVLRNPNIADISGSNGFESDNDGTGTYNTPRTQPHFSNITVVGPMADTAGSRNPNYRRGAHLRRATQTSIYNSIIMGFPIGLLIDGSGSAGSAIGDTLQIKNSIWAGLRANNGITTNAGGFDVEAWYDNPANDNRKYTQPSEVMLIDPFNLTNPNPVPAVGSPASSGSSFSLSRLQDPFFVHTSYIGAFDPSGERWDEGWTNYDPQNTDYVTGIETVDKPVPDKFYLSQNFPNPFNPSTMIYYEIPEAGFVSLKVYDVLGNEIASLFEGHHHAGAFTVSFSIGSFGDASGLSSGVYFYRLVSNNYSITKKMNLLR
jgi:hypothetical protein